MAIAEQFAGLDMHQLIGGPLSAAADASTLLANSTADFINKVGFDDQGNVRNVAFGYQRRIPNEDGTSSLDEMKVSVPMLAIVPIPNLQIDEVNILFDMEVKQSEKQESSLDLGAKLSGTMNLGIIKVNVSGSVSAHQSNTRSSDNSAKYHVDVRATNHGIPEGLARVLDMMAANVAPALVSSSLKDGNGQDLSGQAKNKAERLKELRNDISQIEGRLTAAQNGFSDSIAQLKKLAGIQLNAYREKISAFANKIDLKKDDDEINAAVKEYENNPNDSSKAAAVESAKKKKAADEELSTAYNSYMNEIDQSWGNFMNQAESYIELIADSGEEPANISDMFALKALKTSSSTNDGVTTTTLDGVKAYENQDDGSQYTAMVAAQKKAISSQKNVTGIENELMEKRAEYNDTMSGKAAALPNNNG